MAYATSKDSVISSLGTLNDPDRNTVVEVSLRSYNGGPPKVALQRFPNDALEGPPIRLGRLSVAEMTDLFGLQTAYGTALIAFLTKVEA